ncbi:MAG TPA: 6-carboxytetrahydropterin synthase [Bacteroidales bacterium]|nr:6-carboxytetrahydropterin synthase [Bacteroidales bacterium]
MASVIRVTREFSFEMAHALMNYDGPCRNVHGHSYRLFVTIRGNPVNDRDNPKNGMVMDFSDIKKIIKKEIISVFDHSLIVGKDYDEEKMKVFKSMFDNVILADYQPTCENLVADFAVKITKKLPPEVKLHSLRLYETANSFTEWFASDNE